MATIIQVSDTRFIAGDAATVLEDGEHWCESCGGDGLDCGYDDELTVCYVCCGSGVVLCTDTACLTHSTLHPLSRVFLASLNSH